MSFLSSESQAVDIVGDYQSAGADQLCIDFTGNDPQSFALFVEEVMVHFQEDD